MLALSLSRHWGAQKLRRLAELEHHIVVVDISDPGVRQASAFRGQTPDENEMYFNTGEAVPADLTRCAAAPRQARVEANRTATCEACPSVDAAA